MPCLESTCMTASAGVRRCDLFMGPLAGFSQVVQCMVFVAGDYIVWFQVIWRQGPALAFGREELCFICRTPSSARPAS